MSNVLTGKDMIATLDSLEVGTPLLVDAGNGDYIQAIYQGIGDIQYRTAYMFYDDSGISGSFGLSKKFILENPGVVSMILDDNDPTKVSKLLQGINSNTSIRASKSSLDLHKAFDDLDDRFDFDLDDEFEIYVGNERVPCYVSESLVFGNGSGITYTIVTPISGNNHWQMDSWIQRGLDEYFREITDGSDYTYGLGATEEADVYEPDVPADYFYVTDVDIYPYQNVSPYGEYGIDYGVEASTAIDCASGREFRTSTIDPETGMEIILSDVSYNHAMSWLESHGFTHYDRFDVIANNEYEFEFSEPADRLFVYDEVRGLLLGN